MSRQQLVQCAVESLEGRRLLAASAFPLVIGSTGGDFGNAVAADSAGNIVVVGDIAGAAVADPATGAAPLAAGAFAAKYAPDGTLIWARQFAGATLNKVATDRDNSVYLAGGFSGTVDFDPRRGIDNLGSRGGSDAFVVKLSAKGNLLIARTFGGAGDDAAAGLAVDRAGNMWVGGTFKARANFKPGGSFKIGNSGGADGFIVALDDAGEFRWAGSFGGSGDDTIADLALDDSDNVIATGHYLGNVDFDPTNGVSSVNVAGTQQSYVLKWDSTGGFVFADGFGGTGVAFGSSVTADRSGNVYALGNFTQTSDFDPGAGTFNITAPATGQVYVVKLHSDGSMSYAKSLGGSSSPNVGPGEISVDKGQNVVITGAYSGTEDFDPGAGTSNLTSEGQDDVFVAKLDSAGAFLFAKSFGGTGDSGANGSVFDRDGDILLTGNFDGAADFPQVGGGTIAHVSAGITDIFLDKLDSTGTAV